MKSARTLLRKLLNAGAAPQITPRPGQSPAQWIANLTANIEATWHLCRFTTIKPTSDANLQGEGRRLQQELRDRLPVLYDAIKEDWQYMSKRPAKHVGMKSPTEVGRGD